MPSVFLSPSTQPFNLYLTKGDEQYWMNLVTDAIIPYLDASQVCWGRNIPDTNVGESIRLSNEIPYDFHLAIHSNAAPEALAGQLRGSHMYYNEHREQSRRAAQIFADNMKNIYPIPDLVRIIPNSTLAEITKVNAVSILVEVAYHDNPEDEKWIMENIGAIGRNLAESTCSYLGVPFVAP